MRYLVTGGGGFIGSHLAETLVADGHDVVVLDRDPRYVVDGARMVVADLVEPGVAASVVTGADAVFHLAARVGLEADFSDAPSYVADNELATTRLLAALAAQNFDGRLVLSSSMVVYGEGRYRCARHGPVVPAPRRVPDLDAGRFEPYCSRCDLPLKWELVEEDAPLDPRSVYAATKVSQERLCELWTRDTGASTVALRYHNVYGPRLPLDTPYAGVAAIFRSALRAGLEPRVFEDGKQTRDFVHVRDVVTANLVAAKLPIPAGMTEAINICSGRPVTIGDIASAIADAYGPDAPRPVVTGRWRHGDVRHVVASPAKAQRLLGLTDTVDVRMGMAELAKEAE